MKVNLYHGLSNAGRKKLDKELRRRRAPRMVYQTSCIVQGRRGELPKAVPVNSTPLHTQKQGA